MKKNNKAVKHLSKDLVMARLIKKHGEINFDYKSDLFEDLITAIINQQLSDKAANTIYERFIQLVGKKPPTPTSILKKSDEQIRQVGISYSKISYIKGIADAVLSNELLLKDLPSLSDEEVAKQLTKLKGVGPWTAEMFLIFSLKRPDIFSMGDLGLRTAVSKLYKVDRENLTSIEQISLRWKPFRSYASRYLWKSLS